MHRMQREFKYGRLYHTYRYASRSGVQPFNILGYTNMHSCSLDFKINNVHKYNRCFSKCTKLQDSIINNAMIKRNTRADVHKPIINGQSTVTTLVSTTLKSYRIKWTSYNKLLPLQIITTTWQLKIMTTLM
jgi:hypothetical protein